MKDKVVVIKFPIWSYDFATLKDQFDNVHKYLEEKGYNWDMIMIPRDCDWSELSYDELTNIRDMINQLLEARRYDSNAKAGTGSETSS